MLMNELQCIVYQTLTATTSQQPLIICHNTGHTTQGKIKIPAVHSRLETAEWTTEGTFRGFHRDCWFELSDELFGSPAGSGEGKLALVSS